MVFYRMAARDVACRDRGELGMNGDPLFWNKVIGSVLTAGLIAMVSGFVAHLSYHPHVPEKPHYVIGGSAPVEEASATTGNRLGTGQGCADIQEMPCLPYDR